MIYAKMRALSTVTEVPSDSQSQFHNIQCHSHGQAPSFRRAPGICASTSQFFGKVNRSIVSMRIWKDIAEEAHRPIKFKTSIFKP